MALRKVSNVTVKRVRIGGFLRGKPGWEFRAPTRGGRYWCRSVSEEWYEVLKEQQGYEPTSVLSAEGSRMQFGGVVALDDVSIAVRPDELFAVIGPNGAGKTSLMNCLSGFYRPQKGRVMFNG